MIPYNMNLDDMTQSKVQMYLIAKNQLIWIKLSSRHQFIVSCHMYQDIDIMFWVWQSFIQIIQGFLWMDH